MLLRMEIKTFWSRDVPAEVRAAACKRVRAFVEEMQSLGVLIKSEDVEETEYSIGADKPVTFRFSEVDDLRHLLVDTITLCNRASDMVNSDKMQDDLNILLLKLAETRARIEQEIGG